MILRWERDCSLSSTQRIVRFGFIGLYHPLGGRDTRVAKPTEVFLNMKSKSERNANEKPALCKVPPMLMRLSGYCFSGQRIHSNVFGRCEQHASKENLSAD